MLQRYNLARDNVSLNATSQRSFIEMACKETKIYRSRLCFHTKLYNSGDVIISGTVHAIAL